MNANRKLTPRQLELLGEFVVTDGVARFNGPPIKDWATVKQLFTLLGATWKTGKPVGGFHFAAGVDAEALIDATLERGEVLDPSLVGFYPTPPEVVEVVLGHLDLQPGMTVLEPSAGLGALVVPLLGKAGIIVCFELLPHHCTELRRVLPGVSVHCGDFLATTPRPVFDRIPMNPPFDRGLERKHVLHAYKALAPGGRLVSVLPDSTDWPTPELFPDGAFTSYKLPEGSFRHAGKGTMIRTRVLVLEKNDE